MEKRILRQIQLLAPKHGVRLFRNNVGLFETLDGRKVTTGLAKGSADLIGWATIQVNGHKVGVFISVEVKRPGGRISEAQTSWLGAVNAAGGIGMVVYSAQEFVTILRSSLKALKGLSISKMETH